MSVSGLLWAKIVITGVVAAGVGIAGFNMVSTGCVLGACGTSDQASVQTVATEGVSGEACALACSGEKAAACDEATNKAACAEVKAACTEAKASCEEAKACGAVVTEVALATECSEEAKAACEREEKACGTAKACGAEMASND